MPLSEDELLARGCSGQVAATFENLDAVQDRIEDFLRNTIPRCASELAELSGGSARKTNEKQLAAHLGKALMAYAQEAKSVFSFWSEDPDEWKKRRTVDYSVIPSVGRSHVKVGSHYYAWSDVFYSIEAKRLPTPAGRAGEGDRSREYVVGDWAQRSSATKRKSGGIERFKEGEHASGLARAGMIAFIQYESPAYWHALVNQWIGDLISLALPSHTAFWTAADLLTANSFFSAAPDFAEFSSTHARNAPTAAIALRHYWLSLS